MTHSDFVVNIRKLRNTKDIYSLRKVWSSISGELKQSRYEECLVMLKNIKKKIFYIESEWKSSDSNLKLCRIEEIARMSQWNSLTRNTEFISLILWYYFEYRLEDGKYKFILHEIAEKNKNLRRLLKLKYEIDLDA